ncbi:hypothetical protein HUW51_17095 [Adhaeribacter swui]|uniref:Uncharacterized protein n=1 Tax=Adhaeribacter swui TaxID=2086471 RepID=A0A7G7GB21_9BACT|nr:hypothetical protein [Adhaeribacter swui]QNF34355.1 hypothetical protein HUW51_17095 [Adhaeribacter swui]
MNLEITQWLRSNRDYGTGVALYDRLGSNQVLKQLFAHGEYSFTRRKLEDALQVLLDQDPAPVEEKIAKVPQKFPKTSENTPKASAAPASVRDKMRPLLDERTMLHNRLGLYQELGLSPEEMKQIAFRILALTRQITPLYQQTALAAPVVPAPAAVDFSQLSGLEQHKKLANLRSLRTKIKNKPNRAPDLPAIEAQIQQLEQLIQSSKTND